MQAHKAVDFHLLAGKPDFLKELQLRVVKKI